MKMKNKLLYVGFSLVIFTAALASCSNAAAVNSSVEIPPELKNTQWVRQIDTNTFVLTLGWDSYGVSSCCDSGMDGEWRYDISNRGSCCQRNGPFDSADFQYMSGSDTLCISGCSGRSSYLNGNWARAE